MNGLQLDYLFTPADIDTSTTVTVQVVLAPPQGQTVQLRSIDLTIFPGTASNALAATIPTPSIDPGWTLSTSEGHLTLTPPTAGISTTCTLTFADVLVNDTPGTVAAFVLEEPPGQAQGAVQTLQAWTKDDPTPVPVGSFWADPPVLLDRDLPTKIMWSASAAGEPDLSFQLSVLPPPVQAWPPCPCTAGGDDDCYDWQDGSDGVPTLALQQTSTFTLVAYTPGQGGSRVPLQTLTADVYVQTPSFGTFNADRFIGGRLNRLQWVALGATTCTLTVDQPPGAPVPTDTHDLPWLVPVARGPNPVSLVASNGTGHSSETPTLIAEAVTQPGGQFGSQVSVLAAATSGDGAVSAVLTGLEPQGTDPGHQWTVALTVITAGGTTAGIQWSGGQNPATAPWSLEMTSDGSALVIGGPWPTGPSGTAWSWSTNGSPVRQVCDQPMLAVALADDTTVVAVCGDGTLRVIALDSGAEFGRLALTNQFLEPQLALAPDGSAAVVTEVTGWLGCVSLADLTLLWQDGLDSGPTAVAITQDQHVLVALDDQVAVVDLADGPAGPAVDVTMPGAVVDLTALSNPASSAITDCPFGLAVAVVQGDAGGLYALDAAVSQDTTRSVLLADCLDLGGVTPSQLAVAADGYHAMMVAGTPPTVSFLATPPNQAPPAPTSLVTGQFVCTGSALTSPNGQYTATLDSSGGLALDGPLGQWYGHPYWAVEPGTATGPHLMILGTDGQLTISAGTGAHDRKNDVWATCATGDDPNDAYVLTLGDDGSLVVNQVTANLSGADVYFVWRGDLLFPGQGIEDEQWLVAPRGHFRAHSWNNGQLAIERSDSATTGPGGGLVNAQKSTWIWDPLVWTALPQGAGDQGWLVTIDGQSGALAMTCEGDTPWSRSPTTPGNGPYFAAVTDSGELTICQGTQGNNVVVWNSTNDP